MSVKATVSLAITVDETITSGVPDASASNAVIKHNGFNTSKVLTGSSAQPVTKTASFTKALSSGSGTIDLTALPGTNGATVDGTGLKVQLLKIKAKLTNANTITIAKGASNGYVPAGGSAFSVTLAPGQEIVIDGNEATPDIGSGAKTLDLTGTGAQELDVQVVMG